MGQIALHNNFKRKRPSEFGLSCSFSDIPKVSSQISIQTNVNESSLLYIVIPKTEYQLNMRVQQVVPPHKSTDGMRKRMKTMNVDSCAFSVRKSLSTSVLTGTSTLSLSLSPLSHFTLHPNLHTVVPFSQTNFHACKVNWLIAVNLSKGPQRISNSISQSHSALPVTDNTA